MKFFAMRYCHWISFLLLAVAGTLLPLSRTSAQEDRASQAERGEGDFEDEARRREREVEKRATVNRRRRERHQSHEAERRERPRRDVSFHEQIERLQRQIDQLRSRAHHEEAESLAERSANLRRDVEARADADRQHHRDRLHHVMRAIQHLREAGLYDEADRLLQRTERWRVDSLSRHDGPPPYDSGPRPEHASPTVQKLHDAIVHLSERVRNSEEIAHAVHEAHRRIEELH